MIHAFNLVVVLSILRSCFDEMIRVVSKGGDKNLGEFGGLLLGGGRVANLKMSSGHLITLENLIHKEVTKNE